MKDLRERARNEGSTGPQRLAQRLSESHGDCASSLVRKTEVDAQTVDHEPYILTRKLVVVFLLGPGLDHLLCSFHPFYKTLQTVWTRPPASHRACPGPACTPVTQRLRTVYTLELLAGVGAIGFVD